MLTDDEAVAVVLGLVAADRGSVSVRRHPPPPPPRPRSAGSCRSRWPTGLTPCGRASASPSPAATTRPARPPTRCSPWAPRPGRTGGST
jgi:hypothetical protein